MFTDIQTDMFKKLLRFLFNFLFVSASTLLLLELSYRYYWIDFYNGSLIGLNSETDLLTGEDRPSILVIGDSFSADKDSYVGHLRDSLSSFRVINSAIPGTTVRQHRILAKDRIQRFDPDILLYQIYVGNDLFEYRHPTVGGDMSFARRCYWWLTDRMLVLGYINAKLPQLKAWIGENPNPGLLAKISNDYAIDKYSQRSKIQFSAAPHYLEETVLLQGEQTSVFDNYVEELEELLSWAKDDCRLVVLVMPHCAQLGSPYLERMIELGAEIEKTDAIKQLIFPFLTQLSVQLSDRDIHFVNGLKYLRQAQEQGTKLYYENDPHLNPDGQFVIAQGLISILQE